MKAHLLPSKHHSVTGTFDMSSWVQDTGLLSTALTNKQSIVCDDELDNQRTCCRSML